MISTDNVEQLRNALLALEQAAETRLASATTRQLVPSADRTVIAKRLEASFDFASPIASETLLDNVMAILAGSDLDSTHPRYFGLFNPPSLPISTAADALVAMLNPQVGTWTHAPAANEVERHTLRYLARRIGFSGDGPAHFTSGGQEANATAVANALHDRFASFASDGLRSLPGTPRIYASEHAHHSFAKAAQFLGLGRAAVREVAADGLGGMNAAALTERIAKDTRSGDIPLMIVGTAGTTGTGAIDPLLALRNMATEIQAWFHVDAAWGGGALMSERLRPHLAGIETADSVTWDAHKWLDVPMGAGMLFYREPTHRGHVFHTDTGYVPSDSEHHVEPYQSTMQWSRRFIGLKVFMALASLSRSGYAGLVEHQTALANDLRRRLREHGWEVVNDTPLPVVCCRPPKRANSDGSALHALVGRIVARGHVWLSTLTPARADPMVRICITSYRSTSADLDVLMDELTQSLK